MINIRPEILHSWAVEDKRNDNTFTPANPALKEEIEKIERKIGLILPDDLKWYLENHGFRTLRSHDSLRVRYHLGNRIKEVPVLIDWLFDIPHILKELKLLSTLSDDNTSVIPLEMIPIAKNSTYNKGYYLLDLSKKNYGKVWYWEQTWDEWGNEDNNYIGAVSNSFKNLIESINTLEENEKEMIKSPSNNLW